MTRRATLALGWALAILALCSIPGDEIADWELFSYDKLGHLAMFFGLGWLWARAAPARLGAVVAGGLAFAAGTEVWQAVMPLGRSGDPFDALADAVGLGLGVAAAVWMHRRQAVAASR